MDEKEFLQILEMRLAADLSATVVDLRFDHRPKRVSRGHFTNYLKGVWHE
jgi:hypothetical protein